MQIPWNKDHPFTSLYFHIFKLANFQIALLTFIHLTTFVAAPPERVFDLSRSVDLHRQSMNAYAEQVVDGVRSGLMNEGDTVTWTARHLMKQRRLKVRITAMKRPDFFSDEQVEGDFVKMKHEHYFKPVENGTIMIDQFHFETGYGWAGRLFSQIYLEKYMTRLLTERNAIIKKAAESNGWKPFLNL